MPTTPSYRSPPPVRVAGPSSQRVAVLGMLALALVQLLVCHLNDPAPLRRHFGRDMPLARAAVDQAELEDPLVRLAGGRPLELHFVEAPPSPATGMSVCRVYFGLNYAMFPSRAYVGDGRHLINDADTVRAADRLPPDARLRAGGVAAVVTVGLTPTTLRTTVRPIGAGLAGRP